MKKPSKKDIIEGIQFFIMLYTMGAGFWSTYLWTWNKCGLPIEEWSLAMLMGLAVLSVFCFCQWCKRGAENA